MLPGVLEPQFYSHFHNFASLPAFGCCVSHLKVKRGKVILF